VELNEVSGEEDEDVMGQGAGVHGDANPGIGELGKFPGEVSYNGVPQAVLFGHIKASRGEEAVGHSRIMRVAFQVLKGAGGEDVFGEEPRGL
jgi:hypothetical protein